MSRTPWPRIGEKIRFHIGDTRTLYHVLAHAEGVFMVKRWRAAKQRWHYECLDVTWFMANRDFIKISDR